MSSRIPALALVVAGALVPVGAYGAEPDPALIVVLSDIHGDPSPEVLARFGSGLPTALRDVILDDGAPRLARIRALAALAREDAPAAFELATRFARDGEAPIRLRLAAVWTLGRRLAARPGVVDVLSDVLSDPDPGLRAASVRALARVATPRAEAVLTAQRLAERDAVVRKALREAEARRLGRTPEALPQIGRAHV